MSSFVQTVLAGGLLACAAMGCSGAVADPAAVEADIKVKKTAIAEREYRGDESSNRECELGWFSRITFSKTTAFGGELAPCTTVSKAGGRSTLLTTAARLVAGTYKLGRYDRDADETQMTIRYEGHVFLYKVSYGGSGPHDSTFTMFLEEIDGVARRGMDAEDDLNTMSDE